LGAGEDVGEAWKFIGGVEIVVEYKEGGNNILNAWINTFKFWFYFQLMVMSNLEGKSMFAGVIQQEHRQENALGHG
jgi:hypothetical protein